MPKTVSAAKYYHLLHLQEKKINKMIHHWGYIAFTEFNSNILTELILSLSAQVPCDHLILFPNDLAKNPSKNLVNAVKPEMQLEEIYRKLNPENISSILEKKKLTIGFRRSALY